MRHAHIALAATIAGLMVSATPSNAAPGATLTSPQPTTASSRRSRFFRAVITGNIPMALLPPSWCRTCPRRAARGSRGAGHRGAAAASDKLWRISLLERPELRRRPLQQALPRTAAVAEAGSRLLRRVLEMNLDLCGFFDLINLAPSSRARRRHGSRPSLRGSVKSPDATIRDAISSMSSDRLDYAGSIEAVLASILHWSSK